MTFRTAGLSHDPHGTASYTIHLILSKAVLRFFVVVFIFIDNRKLVYGITIRLAGIAVLLNNSEQTVSVAQGKQIDAAVRFLQNGRHNSYQPYWYDSSTFERSAAATVP